MSLTSVVEILRLLEPSSSPVSVRPKADPLSGSRLPLCDSWFEAPIGFPVFRSTHARTQPFHFYLHFSRRGTMKYVKVEIHDVSLTGLEQKSNNVTAFGPTIITEGFDPSSYVAWVHTWTELDGIITQVYEYSNNSLTLTRVGTAADQPDTWDRIVDTGFVNMMRKKTIPEC